MSTAHFAQFNGRAVRLRVNDEEALGILFCNDAAVSVTTLCFTKAAGRCPLLRHDLTPGELLSLRAQGRRPAMSSIHILSR